MIFLPSLCVTLSWLAGCVQAEERSKRLDYLEECITKGLFFSELDRFGYVQACHALMSS